MLDEYITVADFENRTSEVMPTVLFDRLLGKLGDPVWLTNTINVRAFDEIRLRPRVMVDISNRDLSTNVLGHNLNFPVIIASAGPQQRAHPEGELASARAAGSEGVVVGLSNASSYSIEEVADAASGPLWFQLYFFQDREINRTLIRRAEQAGYSAIILTVDIKREGGLVGRMISSAHNYSYDYAMEPGRNLKNLEGIDVPDLPRIDNFAESFDPTLNWSHLEWLRSVTKLPIIIKGIQTAEDARLCVEHGVDALVVSNHGGYALQGTQGTIEMLPEVVDAVGGRLEVLMDGGIRRGSDVLKALALGAKAVLIGRAVFWGLAVSGEEGVQKVLQILRDELFVAMGLCGVANIRDIDRSLVVTPGESHRFADMVGRLERLSKLLDQGYLSREEFEIVKAKLLMG